MRLIACLIEVSVHYGAVYRILYEHGDAESFCFGCSTSSQAHVGIAGALWGRQKGQWLWSIFFPGHRPSALSSAHEKKMP